MKCSPVGQAGDGVPKEKILQNHPLKVKEKWGGVQTTDARFRCSALQEMSTGLSVLRE